MSTPNAKPPEDSTKPPEVKPDTTPTTQPPVPQPDDTGKDKKKTVTIDAAKLDEIMSRLNNLESDNSMLRDLAGKSAVRGYEESRKDTAVKVVTLKKLLGKPIVSWRSGTQELIRNNEGLTVGEVMTLFVKTIDGTEKEMRHIDFYHINEYESYLVRGQRTDDLTRKTYFKLEDKFGKSIEVDSDFVNP